MTTDELGPQDITQEKPVICTQLTPEHRAQSFMVTLGAFENATVPAQSSWKTENYATKAVQ